MLLSWLGKSPVFQRWLAVQVEAAQRQALAYLDVPPADDAASPAPAQKCQALGEQQPPVAPAFQETAFSQTTLAPNAQLMPGASVLNGSGDPAAIRLGEHSIVRGRLITYGHGGDISFGDWCYVGERSEIWSMASITIGHRVLISHDVNIHDGTAHSLDPVERHAHYRAILATGHPTDGLPGVASAPIVIEDDAWISFGVTILKGVTIGKGAVIAAKSIVTKDVPPYTIYRNEIVPHMRPLPDAMRHQPDPMLKAPGQPDTQNQPERPDAPGREADCSTAAATAKSAGSATPDLPAKDAAP